MMCRISIFALLTAAMTFAAGAVSIEVNASVDSHIDSVTVKAGNQSMTLAKNGSADWKGWVVGTAYSVTATGVATGYTAKWKVSTNNVEALSGDTNKTIKLTSTAFSGCSLIFYGEPNTYTVTLERESGSGGPSSVTATYDADMPATNMPTRTGYTFDGFYTITNNSNTQYYKADGTSARPWNIASNATLYAKWTANTYTVTLDQQSGSGGTASVEATYDAEMPEAVMPTRDGYAFGGYYTEANGSGTKYYNADGTSARTCKLTADTTLYAKWTAAAFTITLDRQDGSGGTPSVTATYGGTLPSITKPTRAGYKFNGYYEKVNGGGEQYYASTGTPAGVSPFTSNTTIYAYWTPNPTVTFDLKGGSFKSGSVWTSTTNYEEGVGLPFLPSGSDVAFANHSFDGWYEEGSTLKVESISPSARGDKNLFAKWKEDFYYVTFKANDGTEKSGEQELPMANPTNLRPVSGLFARPGYEFTSWNTMRDGTGSSYEDQAQISNDNSLTNEPYAYATLYAQWMPNPYEVEFLPNGADGGETMANQSFVYDATQNLNAVEFTYTGRAFEKWSSDTNYTYQTKYYFDGGAVANLATGGVAKLYANWTNNVYTVAFDPNGGTGAMDPITCMYTVPTNLPWCAFERDGWGFKGWTNNLAEGVLFLDHARVTNLTTRAEEVQMYACWTGATYSVVFDTLGKGVMTNGVGEEVSVLTNPYVVGDLWDNFPVPTNVDTQHWDFAGWAYVDAQGKTKPIPAEVPPPSTGTTNLVATWSRKADALAAAVDAPELLFSTFGTQGATANPSDQSVSAYGAVWFAQTNFVHGSTNAVQSGALPVNSDDGNLYVSWLTTTVEGKGVLSFWWKCDAKPLVEEANVPSGWCGDTFKFGLYDPAQGITHEVAQLTEHEDWCCVTYTNETDSSVSVAWAFVYTDYGANNGGGTGWVDRVTWTPDGAAAEVTPTHSVPYSWLRENFTVDASTDFESLAEGDSPSGKPMKVWQEYWTGTDPNDPNDLFRAYIAVTNDVPYISWRPDLSVTGMPVRVYKVLCAPTPSAQDWVEWPGFGDSGAATNRFFKVELDWEESLKK